MIVGSSTSWKQLRLYQYGYWFVSVHTHGDCLVLSYWTIWVVASMTQYPTQWHYPDTELTSPCPILLLPSTRLGEWHILILQVFDLTRSGTELPNSHMRSPCTSHWASTPDPFKRRKTKLKRIFIRRMYAEFFLTVMRKYNLHDKLASGGQRVNCKALHLGSHAGDRWLLR